MVFEYCLGFIWGGVGYQLRRLGLGALAVGWGDGAGDVGCWSGLLGLGMSH